MSNSIHAMHTSQNYSSPKLEVFDPVCIACLRILGIKPVCSWTNLASSKFSLCQISCRKRLGVQCLYTYYAQHLHKLELESDHINYVYRPHTPHLVHSRAVIHPVVLENSSLFWKWSFWPCFMLVLSVLGKVRLSGLQTVTCKCGCTQFLPGGTFCAACMYWLKIQTWNCHTQVWMFHTLWSTFCTGC